MSMSRPAGSIPAASRQATFIPVTSQPEASTPVTSRPATSIPVASRPMASIPPALRRGISSGTLTVTTLQVPSTPLSSSQFASTPLPVESGLAAQDFHCGGAIKIFNKVDDDSIEVNINDYYEIDSEDVDTIKKNPVESLKDDIKSEVGDYEPERPLKKLSCNQCDSVFNTSRTLHRHKERCHPVKTEEKEDIEKSVSEKRFSEKRIMKKCPSCEQEFDVSKSSYKLVCHLRLIHHDEDLSSVIEELELGDKGRVVCQICGETKRNKNILATHIKTIHEESGELVPCQICGKLLRQNYGSMYSHHRSHHAGETTCKYCGKIFKNKIYARHHMKTHEPDFKKFECKECGAKLDTMAHLKNHRRYVHMQIKEAKCDICGKMFSTKSKMNIHRNSVHSQEKQFACEFCPFRSARKDNLQAHRKKNHGEDKKIMAHKTQMGEISFYLKDTNSVKSETPQMPAIKEELPTYLKVPSSVKTETTRTQMTQPPAFLKDPLELDTLHAHHMGEFPTHMRTSQKEDMKNYKKVDELSYLKD